MKLSREDNKKSIEALKKQGIKIIPAPPDSEMAHFYEAGKIARRMLVPKLYPLSLVEEVENALEEFRKAN